MELDVAWSDTLKADAAKVVYSPGSAVVTLMHLHAVSEGSSISQAKHAFGSFVV